jgi:hypothetical protein
MAMGLVPLVRCFVTKDGGLRIVVHPRLGSTEADCRAVAEGVADVVDSVIGEAGRLQSAPRKGKRKLLECLAHTDVGDIEVVVSRVIRDATASARLSEGVTMIVIEKLGGADAVEEFKRLNPPHARHRPTNPTKH